MDRRLQTAIRTVQFCKECNTKLYMPGTINSLGFPEPNLWQRDSAGRNKCFRIHCIRDCIN